MLGSKLYHEFNSIDIPDFTTKFNLLVRELGERGKKDPSMVGQAKEIVAEYVLNLCCFVFLADLSWQDPASG